MSDLVLGFSAGLFTASAISILLVVHLGQKVRELVRDNKALEAAQERADEPWYFDSESLTAAVDLEPVASSEGTDIINLSPEQWREMQ